MIGAAFIVGGYVALVAAFGWWGVVAVVAHIAVMLAGVSRW